VIVGVVLERGGRDDGGGLVLELFGDIGEHLREGLEGVADGRAVAYAGAAVLVAATVCGASARRINQTDAAKAAMRREEGMGEDQSTQQEERRRQMGHCLGTSGRECGK